MTAVLPMTYSPAVADAAAARDLVLATSMNSVLGMVVAVFPAERPDVVFGSAWQPSPGGWWRAAQSFVDPSAEWFATADEAIMHAMGGGRLSERPGYLWGRKKPLR